MTGVVADDGRSLAGVPIRQAWFAPPPRGGVVRYFVMQPPDPFDPSRLLAPVAVMHPYTVHVLLAHQDYRDTLRRMFPPSSWKVSCDPDPTTPRRRRAAVRVSDVHRGRRVRVRAVLDVMQVARLCPGRDCPSGEATHRGRRIVIRVSMLDGRGQVVGAVVGDRLPITVDRFYWRGLVAVALVEHLDGNRPARTVPIGVVVERRDSITVQL